MYLLGRVHAFLRACNQSQAYLDGIANQLEMPDHLADD
jgi:hypothetical protein